MTVATDERGDIAGYGLFDYQDTSYVGDLHGERFDSDVHMILDGDNGDGFVRLEVIGTVVDDQIEGQCKLFGVDGVLFMQQADVFSDPNG